MANLPAYSPFFSCLYNEAVPVGSLGRGTHYSVLSCATSISPTLGRLSEGHIQKFALIWDEDHDTRVIRALERIYMTGLLSPVLFVGERKAMLTLILDVAVDRECPAMDLPDYQRRVTSICGDLGFDSWIAHFGRFDPDERNCGEEPALPSMIISDDDMRVITYLRNIHALWEVGVKKYGADEDEFGV
jgi:hypothetical protein